MKQRKDGLWFTTDSILKPPMSPPNENINISPHIQPPPLASTPLHQEMICTAAKLDNPANHHQNGLAERPHWTLKEKVRCLLYTAGLGIPFWSCALLHAVWLYNHTFHSGLDLTPYQSYTKHQPTLDGLLTFGSRITPKKSTQQGTALDPNAHDGIFLGYRATMDNIL
jgi:hypothetical protein